MRWDIKERWDTGNTQHRVYSCEVNQILVELIREDFLEEGSFIEQLE